MASEFPVGVPVDPHPAPRPERKVLEGLHTRLVPVDVSHAAGLYEQLCDASQPTIWSYMGGGPFDSAEAFEAHVKGLAASTDPHFFTIIAKDDALAPHVAAGAPAGYLSLMRIEPAHRVVEVGHVTFSPRLQRTTVATEALQLVMEYALGELGYRRLEWKCDSLNAKSRRAAARLGFVFEGVFRKHLIVKGRNRDTAWFSITDDEWPVVGGALKSWLEPANFKDGVQIKKLEAIREELKAAK